jgi:hypothetical protein
MVADSKLNAITELIYTLDDSFIFCFYCISLRGVCLSIFSIDCLFLLVFHLCLSLQNF